MTLSIRDPETDRLARGLAARTGKSITTVVKEALDQYAAAAPCSDVETKRAKIEALFQRWDAMPRALGPSSRELIEDLYDEDGLPK